MSLPDSAATADGESDPSIEIYGSDADANVSEDPEEEEYEVEVEEEIEEEEVEEEDEEEEVENEYEVSEPPENADKDLSQHMESEGQERTLRPVSSEAVSPHIVSVEKNDSCKSVTTKKDDFHPKHVTSSSPNSRNIVDTAEDDKHQGLDVGNENNGSPIHHKTFGEYNQPSCNSKAYLRDVKDSGTAKLSGDTGKDDVAIDFPQRDCSLEDAYVSAQNSMNQIKQLKMQSGDEMKQMTSRLTSPDMRTRSLSPSAEMKDGNKRPAIICNFFAQGWCIRGSSCRFLHIKDQVNNSGQRAEGDLVSTNCEREVQLEEGLGDNAETSRIPNSPHTEGLAIIQSQHMHNKYASQFMSHSPNSSLVAHLPTASMLLSHQISAQSGYLLSFNSSIVASTLDAQKPFNSGKEYYAPKSTFFAREREESPIFSSSGALPIATRYKAKVSCDWELSVPFQPSFFITPTSMSSPGDLYDPFHPSVETLNIGDGSLKASYFIQGPPIQASSQVQTYGAYAVAGDRVADLNDDKSSVSSHNRLFENEPNKSCDPREKDCRAPETETTVGTYLNSHNGKSRMGENTLGVEDITKTEIERTENDARHQGEGSRHKRKRVDKAKKNNEMNVDFQMKGDMQNGLKASKNFRAALVDLVKELLKPSWQEGRLSKDAHNTIVKKSVDKVISTLQPHQIPTTINTVNHYVSSSRLKITKLVDGYVNKYGKS